MHSLQWPYGADKRHEPRLTHKNRPYLLFGLPATAYGTSPRRYVKSPAKATTNGQLVTRIKLTVSRFVVFRTRAQEIQQLGNLRRPHARVDIA